MSRTFPALVLAVGLALAAPPAQAQVGQAGVDADGRPETLPEGAALRAPQQFLSADGRLDRDLFVQFARARVAGASNNEGRPVPVIWTRAYGTRPVLRRDPIPFLDIPGPTFVYHPGDLLQINLHNQLNQALSRQLDQYMTNTPPNSQDDIPQPIPHELNIPHNANNTNLHVHGMHVDPKQDDVTLLILPEDDNPSNYTPTLQRFVPDVNRWWQWSYRYKLPADHLPGTHWYHAHKHGATSTHVENGMAGTLLLRPREDRNAIVPGLWNDDPALSHDRVLMLQEIANYGIQQGNNVSHSDSIAVSSQAASSDKFSFDWPDITVNGQHQPVLDVAPGQTERWRFVMAGSNHRTSSYLWVAELTLPDALPDSLRAALESITDYESAKPYVQIGGSGSRSFPTSASSRMRVCAEPFPGTVQLVALDGITLSEAVDVSHDRPVVMGPGNRADLIVQPRPDADPDGGYYVIKNYDTVPPQYVLARHPVYGDLFAADSAGYWRYFALTTSPQGVPVTNDCSDGPASGPAAINDLSADPYALGVDIDSFKRPMPARVHPNGAIASVERTDGTVVRDSVRATKVVPLMRGRENGHLVDIDLVGGSIGADGAVELPFPGAGWGVSAGHGLVDADVLMTVRLTGDPVTDGPRPPNRTRLQRLSPTGDAANTLLRAVDEYDRPVRGVPAYVSPISDADVTGRQVVVFDRSGVEFTYEGPDNAGTVINQYSLNGRQFDLSDFVGNPMADRRIEEPIRPSVPSMFAGEGEVGTYDVAGGGSFSNQVTIDGAAQAFWTNPGTYLDMVAARTPDGRPYYTYAYDEATEPPDYRTITGLSAPVQPMAKTAEEWLLVNNSSTFHPFHIHINPLFLTEVGQLDYDTTSSAWAMRRLEKSDPLGYALDNWWDVVIIPPHGYVKFRTWMNIPAQHPRTPANPNSEMAVTENANVFGSWVYHCHILRHEDRGMMMVVNVRPNPNEPRESFTAPVEQPPPGDRPSDDR